MVNVELKIFDMNKDDITKEVVIGSAGYASAIGFVDPIFAPALGVAWELVKSMYSKNNKNNAIYNNFVEFLHFININKDKLIDSFYSDLNLQIGLVLLYEQIIRTRAKWKRDRLFGGYLGFLESKDRDNFQLERIYHTISLVNHDDYNLLVKVINNGFNSISYDFSNTNHGRDSGSALMTEERKVNEDEIIPKYFEIKNLNYINNLLSTGIIYMPAIKLGCLVYEISDFGFEFYKYTFNYEDKRN